MFTLSYWRKLEDDFLNFLAGKGYTPGAITRYRGITNRLVRFANARNDEAYTPEVGKAFLESEERLEYLKDSGYSHQRMIIRRLEEYLDGEKFSFARFRTNYECPEQFKDFYDKYLTVLENSGLKSTTLKQHRIFYAKLFRDFVNNGIEKWDAVDATVLSDAFMRSSNKAEFAGFTKKLFKYLVKENIVKYNYTGILPKIPYRKRIPSVYSNDEIDAILNT